MTKKNLLYFLLFYIFIGIYFSGKSFVFNINNSIHLSSQGGQVIGMAPGDCYEQFHRYSLVKNNFYRGRFPYDSSYQYNLDRNNIFFNEGLVFFPFSLINGIVSFFFGDIISYNIMAILFYILCGIPPKKDIKSV